MAFSKEEMNTLKLALRILKKEFDEQFDRIIGSYTVEDDNEEEEGSRDE